MSPIKVTVFLAVGLCLFTTYLSAEEAKDNAESEDENTIKVYKRLIPADVLRGLCVILRFLILNTKTFSPGQGGL